MYLLYQARRKVRAPSVSPAFHRCGRRVSAVQGCGLLRGRIQPLSVPNLRTITPHIALPRSARMVVVCPPPAERFEHGVGIRQDMKRSSSPMK